MKKADQLIRKASGIFLIVSVFVACLSMIPLYQAAAASDSVCARVKIEIKQELTLERQAFDAHMRITNGFDHVTLENVDIDVNFTDEDGNSILASSDPDNTDARFYIRVDSMENIDNVDGTGSVQPTATADIHWLIIPAAGAANENPQGTLYYVGAKLHYTIGGDEHVTDVSPDYIFVKPLPEIILDYFITQNVYGDDAFTTEIEPSIPFTLGVRASNTGFGAAKSMKIDSAQPKIVENEQGLLIGFAIEGCEVNGASATPSLLADLGNIEPDDSSVARWIMTCSLSGTFVDFTADYSHSDELGGELTSLLQAANTHFLIRDVLVDVAGRDAVRDFLAQDGGVFRVYESDNVDTEVTDQSSLSSLTGSGNDYALSSPATAGFMYLKMTDPHAGQKVIDSVIRADGKRIKAENVWLSKERNVNHEWEYFFNLFDASSSGSYTVTFGDPEEENQSPVLQFIPDRTVIEGNQLSFIVEATDADGTIPVLTTSSLPALALFTDRGDGAAVFDWTPAVGQAGNYAITATASDGLLTDSQRFTVIVRSQDDTDGDGMLDSWEMTHFGTLDRDGTGDFDGDGISDLEEFLNGTNPTQSDSGPSIPEIDSPVDEAEISVQQPELTVTNSTDPDGDVLTYQFEIYSDREMKILVADAVDIAEGSGTTAWAVPVELNDNNRYYWRVRATDGSVYSQWAYGSFFVNTENNPPGAIRVNAPTDTREVDSRTPTLQVGNSVDCDGDVVTYAFMVYEDIAMTTLVASASGIAQGDNGTTAWTVTTELPDSAVYYWKAVAVDEHGAETQSQVATFFVNTQNASPAAPVITAPLPGSEIAALETDLTVANATDPDGDALSYYFELAVVNTFDGSSLRVSGEISEGSETTSWHVDTLEDNTRYFWRVKASDGSADSAWVTGSFLVNTANDQPSEPVMRNPGERSWVDTPTPVLSLNQTEDVDGDDLTYRFEIYGDADLTNLVAEAEADTGQWVVPTTLSDGAWYYWRARSEDEHGDTSNWTRAVSFLVRDDGVDDPPEITITGPAEALSTNAGSLTITWEDSDNDSNADISLYYDSNSSGEDGVLIVSGLKEDDDGPDDVYTWNISGVPEGTWYIYAVIDDGTTSVTRYSASAVTIDRTAQTITFTPAAGTYTSAQDVTLSTDETAQIYFTTDGSEPTVESSLYTEPLTIGETKTVQAIAVDAAGNTSTPVAAVYTIQPDITVTVETNGGKKLAGISTYAFTESGSYTGHNATTDQNGIGHYDPADLSDGMYKFRVDYLGYQFWSDVIEVPTSSAVTVTIDEETIEVSVSMTSGSVEGVKVYLFSESGSYLGVYEITDANGIVSFDLPVGVNYTFRADVLGSQYWSGVTTVTGGGTNSVAINTGGGLFRVKIEKSSGVPMEGIKVYLFSQSGSYLGLNRVTDSSGYAGFDVSGGVYKVRADYLGYQYWSDETLVQDDTVIDLVIPHQEVEVTVAGIYQGVSTPVSGIKIYLFSSTGSYLGFNETTDADGKVIVNLPEKSYLFRVDYLNRQFWSETVTWEDVTVAIPMADAQVTVTGAGLPQEGVNVYAFTPTGSYLGLYETTNASGSATFRLPAGSYTFRADYQGSQFWSGEEVLTADQVNPVVISVGGGSFTCTVLTGGSDPLVGVNCYVFSEGGTYLGLYGATNENGETQFDLSDGTYKFRVDYLGYQFWSDVIEVPTSSAVTVTIDEETVEVSVSMTSGAVEGVKVYLFSESGSYLGVYGTTDANGMVSFDLPVGMNYTFRADVLGSQYWSGVTTVTGGGTNSVAINTGGGLFRVKIEKSSGVPMEGIKVYLFSPTGSYLGLNQVTDSSGYAGFDVSGGVYKVRADYLGYQYWSDETAVSDDTVIDLTIPHQEVEVTIAGIYQGVATPVSGIKVYLFSATGSYLGFYETTDANGKVTFNLPEKAYLFRADYLSRQFWSETVTWEDVTVAIPMADAEVTVTGAGLPQEGVNVYAFTPAGSYLGLYKTTDASGSATFRLPAGSYTFRADYQGNQFWSGEEVLTADQVNPVVISVGGGSFTCTVLTGGSEPLVGVKCYVFSESGTYLGLYGATNESGETRFDLSDGTYKFRVDYLGYQFWSDVIEVPTNFSETVAIPHGNVAITVEGQYLQAEPLAGLTAYLFTSAGSYIGKYATTDDNGRVSFNLPDREYKVRVDYLGKQLWSNVFQSNDATVTITRGCAAIHVTTSGTDVEGAKVYLFSDSDSYLGWYERTDPSGRAEFILPAGSYKFRTDYESHQYWSSVVTVAAGVESTVNVAVE